MTQFLLDEFDAVLWMASRHSFVLPEHLRLPAIKDSLKWEMERSQNTLLARMGEDAFLMGAQMTVPDIILTHCLSWAIAAKFPVETPALVAYAKRMRARPAFKRAAAEFNKAQERIAAERAEAAYQMMLGDQMAKTTSTMRKFAA